ncbi:MAG TPA: beta-propeller fold lactonase family protein, partial [Chlamydiales bacterium]|nr:beta-propeller fold lactonase family protein [Chlamydiales bacterium]
THLISANLIEGILHIFRFCSHPPSLQPVEFISPSLGTGVVKPEHLCFSPDGEWLAVANGTGGKVNFFAVEENSVRTKPVAVLQEAQETKFHSVRFSLDGKHFACATFDNSAKISLFRIQREGKNLSLIPTQVIPNSFGQLKPKGIAFSPDQRFVAICYSKRASWTPNHNLQGVVELYRFNADEGVIAPSPLSRIEAGLCVPEDILFDPLQPCLYIANQGNDTITMHPFDLETGFFCGPTQICLKNPEAELSFPHGISISDDGSYLASSNYGDDKITIYRIKR